MLNVRVQLGIRAQRPAWRVSAVRTDATAVPRLRIQLVALAVNSALQLQQNGDLAFHLGHCLHQVVEVRAVEADHLENVEDGLASASGSAQRVARSDLTVAALGSFAFTKTR